MSHHEQRRAPLANGMPMLGLGTWQNDDPDACAETVATAIEAGYRHVDTAQAYGNEEHVGRGIAATDVDREDVFLATKVWIDNLAYDDVLATADRSLERLGVDSVDLLYVHWPSRSYDPEGTFRAFDELVDDGRIDRIGISNFLPEQVDEAIERADAPIFANQIEMNPLLQQAELREHCAARDVELVAYSPLARGKVFDVPELTEIAEKHDASEAQVSLAWLREKGVTAIPKASSEAHILDNWRSLDLDLDTEDVAAIDAIDRTDRQVDPSFAPW
ncbi:aldo/keto reductase [Halobellus salinisoli]|uniref:aldo/keto reductase n=1 Tax=Halobellus salinisoli TaxID=3108500 RepID=UPI0031F2E503